MTSPDGDPIPLAFEPTDEIARLVVSMSMARNDVGRALRDLEAARATAAPDLTYRARLAIGHFVEGLDALNAYVQEFPTVGEFLKSVPADGRKSLSTARRSLQDAEVLEHARNHTFHYPSPKGKHNSDLTLQSVLAQMDKHPTVIHHDGDSDVITLEFADDIALQLGLGKGIESPGDALRVAEAAQRGAYSFVNWADALTAAYLELRGLDFGTPVVNAKPPRGIA